MANFIFTLATHLIADGDIDWVNDTFRVALLMTNTSIVTDRDTAAFYDWTGVTTNDECDGANYAVYELTTTATVVQTSTNRTDLTAEDAVFTDLGAGTRSNAGALVYKWSGSAATSPLLGWFDDGDFAINGNGSTFTVEWGSGIVFTYTAS